MNNTLAAIPGKTSKKRGRNFRREARTHPALAWLIFLADRVLWTITWSAHQYQMELQKIKEDKNDETYGIYLIIIPVTNPVIGTFSEVASIS